MNDKVLTEDEKSALVDGVESGDVEVQSSSGSTYATVNEFRIPQRAHIERNSYPRLKILNQQVGERLRNDAEQLLQCDVSVTAQDLAVQSYGRACEALGEDNAIVVFEAAPLSGRALIVFDAALVRLLVDAFFGGVGDANDAVTGRMTFTPGELSIANLFSTVVLSAIKDTWAPFQDIAADRVATEVSIDLVDIVAENDPVISSAFEVAFAKHQSIFRLIWPMEMVKPLLPVFDGQKGDRDPVEDARWERVIRRQVADSVVSITTRVGHARLTLGQLADLSPGDVINIDNPQEATILAKDVQLLQGRLGIHRGHNAIETIAWIEP